MLEKLKNNLKRLLKSRNFIIFLLIILIVVSIYFLQRQRIGIKPPFIRGYRLVNEKISQSAAIVIHLPFKMDKKQAQENVKFEPEIEGSWQNSEDSREIVFKPKEKLRLNRYYEVELTIYQSEASLISADFLAVDDPQIIAVFPKEGSEAPEHSEITIVFNRPMVPLTTLDYLEEKDVPVEIIPKTEGRFKWITTRNLQFIPKERLIRSSNYKVKIRDGLVSMDNLEVEGAEINFKTRILRYLNMTKDKVSYSQPISIYFNQEVDLEKTKKEISLRNNTTGQEIAFIAEYKPKEKDSKTLGQESLENGGLFGFARQLISNFSFNIGDIFKSDEERFDRSVIQIYNQKDRFGRQKFWDFENNYSLVINKAYPTEGDIVLDQSGGTNINVAGPIANITAESQRTKYATPDFFDPEGKIWVDFYEEINLSASQIKSDKLKEINYGEKCKEEQVFSSSTDCEKVEDKKKIYLTFKREEIGLNENLEINFEKIVNTQGLTINKEPIKKNITSYPELSILRTFPENNSTNSNLTELIICSNSPIISPAKEDYGKYFNANLEYELNSWNNAWRIEYYRQGQICNIGEFQTSIYYGLVPVSDYFVYLKLEDVFGQKKDYSLGFATGEMPSQYLSFYHFQNTYTVTNPEGTKLTYAVKNMEYLNLEICQVSGLDFLYFLENRPRYYQPLGTGNCRKLTRDIISLPKRFWIKNYFKIDIKDYFEDPVGNYVLSFSHPDYTSSYWEKGKEIKTQVFERTFITVTNLAVAEKKILPQYANYGAQIDFTAEQLEELGNLYLVTEISGLEAVPDAELNLYRKIPGYDFGLTLAGTYKTNEQGIAFTDVFYDLRGVVIKKGNDSTVIPSYESKLNWASSAFSAKRIYLYTEKPIYRPGHEVFIKGIYRIGYDGSYEIYKEKSVELKVFNSRDDEIEAQDLEVSDFGTFNTKIVLSKEAPLGSYRICAEEANCINFDVQEYVPAPFEINVKTDREEYISKDTVNLEVEANYYFGVPLEAGEVSYTVSSQDYYFDRYSDGFFNFGTYWYYWPPYEYGDKFILRGKTELDDSGVAKISQVLDFEKLFKNQEDRKSKIIVADITVKNVQGQSVSSQKSFIVHSGDVYLGIRTDKSFFPKNEDFNIKVKSVDTQGKPKSTRGANLALYKIDWVYSKRLEATGGYSYKWEKKKDLVWEVKFDTDRNGDFERTSKIEQEGEYELEVWVKDSRGNQVSSTKSIYVWGEREVSIRPTTDTTLELEAEKINLNVGEQGKIIIKSPYLRAKALISIERGKIFEYHIIEINGNLYNFNFEVKEDYIPNVFVSVLLISEKPEVKFGSIEFQINTTEKELDVEVSSDKNFYLPGEEIILDVSAKDYQGNPVSAEISLAVVDLSVLALKGNPKKNPLVFFYGGFPLTVSTASNIKNILIETDIPKSKGGGGMPTEESLEVKKRGIFRETAFWDGQVITNEQGTAQVRFTLPDNLTTWQIEALGITKDTRLGTDYKEFITRKGLMVVPLMPRFIIPGDVFQIGAKIFNQTEQNQRLIVSFESSTLILDDNSEKRINIASDKTATLYFKVQAPENLETGEHVFVISAKGQGVEDTVEQKISIYPNETYETVATSNYSSNNVEKEYVFLPDNVIKEKGNLSIKSSATLAVFLSDSLNYLLRFPYGCTEQIASRLNAIAIVKRGLNLPNLSEKLKLDPIEYRGQEYTIDEVIEIGLAELYNNQKYDGGFSYWSGGESDFYLTLYVIETLDNLSLAGFRINENSLSRAADYVFEKITSDRNLYTRKDTVIITAYTLFRLPDSYKYESLKGKIIDMINDDLFMNERISNGSLAYLSILVSDGFDVRLKNKVFDIMDGRIDIDSRGAFLEKGKSFLWQYYETPIKNTALYLKAQVKDERENPILEKVLRWILNSRAKDGAWGSTNSTLAVIDALCDFLEQKRETESNFILEVLVNEQTQGTFEFNKDTILEQFKKEIPLNSLEFAKNNIITFFKENLNELSNNFYYDMALKYYLPVNQIPPRDEGFSVTRQIFDVDDIENKNPKTEAKVGDVLRVRLQITVPQGRKYVMIEDFIPAGMEIVNLDLATEQKSLLLQEKELEGREFYPDFKELYDDRAFLYKENVSPGVYEFDYWVRALIKGKFTHLPTHVSEMYFPENFGRTAGSLFEIK